MVPGGMSDLTIPEFDPPPKRDPRVRNVLIGASAVVLGFLIGWIVAGMSQ